MWSEVKVTYQRAGGECEAVVVVGIKELLELGRPVTVDTGQATRDQELL